MSRSIHELLNISITFEEKIAAEMAKRSLFRFTKEFWSEISADDPSWNWHIPLLCRKAEEYIYRVAANKPKKSDLIINISPGTTKSTIFSQMAPAWAWANWPWMKFICASYSDLLALEQADKCRTIVKSKKYQTYFPYIQMRKDKDSKKNYQIIYWEENEKTGKIEELNGGSRYSTSVGGSLTGFHGHVGIIDDPVSPAQTDSQTELATANRWLGQTLSTRKISKANTPILMIMQRLHENDPTGYMLCKKNKKIEHICLPGTCIGYEVKPEKYKKKYKDGIFDVQRMNKDVLVEMEADLGQYGFAGQVGQQPTPPSGGMFNVKRLTRIDFMPDLKEIVQSVRYWDKAGSHEEGAYTVGVLMHRLKSGQFLVSDVVRGQWAALERENNISRIIKIDSTIFKKNMRTYIEQEGGSGGKESAESTIRTNSGYLIEADRPVGDKTTRADTYSVQVNGGNVLILKADWNTEYKSELQYFPKSTYKDQVDSSSGAFAKLHRLKNVRTY